MVKPSRILLYLVLILLSIIWLLPFYSAVFASFKKEAEIRYGGFLTPPREPSIGAYLKALSELKQGLLNSLVICVPATFLSVFLGALAAYPLSRFRFKGAPFVFFLILIATLIPYQIVLIPTVQLMGSLNLYNTHLGLILTYTMFNTPIATLLLVNFFLTIPMDLQEAALVDGCGPVDIFWRIILPLSASGLAATAIFIFTTTWNEFLFALTISGSPEVRPAMPTLAALKGTTTVEWSTQMAGAVLASLPVVGIYVLLGKYFIKGLLAGAVRG